MSGATIQSWTNAHVWLETGEAVDVKYQVFRSGKKCFLEMCDAAGEPIHTLELPDGVKLDKSSYDVFLRYILLDVVAA
jgi:hypothetical protein